ncbi:MAG: DUF3999 domain-containing protein [Parabacteroides sp.]|nr:DUF3999 domain-containing protein [Parabacteroides sp.]
MKQRKNHKCRLGVALCLLGCLSGVPEVSGNSGYRYTAGLPPVTESGFYAVELPGYVRGAARADLADVRILDSRDKETAYLVRRNETPVAGTPFQPYPVQVKNLPSRTEIQIEAGNRALSSFALQVKNTAVDKTASLRGSNDGQQWYAVKETFPLRGLYDQRQTTASFEITFPLSDYRYYLLTIDDSLSAPLNVIQVGQPAVASYARPELSEVKPSGLSVREEGKETGILLTFPCRYDFSEIVFYVSSPRFFRREIVFSFPSAASSPAGSRKSLLQRRDGRSGQPYRSYVGSVLESDGKGMAALDWSQYTDTLDMRIRNGDDQPLRIDSIKTYIDRLYLAAYLEAGETYRLAYGNGQAQMPVYDLSFRSHIPDSLPRLMPASTSAVPAPDDAASGQTAAWLPFFRTYGIWIIIVLVILQILWLVKKMIKQ